MYTKETVASTARWILTMQKLHDAQTGMQCFDAVRSVFGDELCADVLFSIMSNTHTADAIEIDCSNLGRNQLINSIKAVRWLSGFSLKEAKDAVELSLNQTVTVPLKPECVDPNEEQARVCDGQINDLRSYGARVKLVYHRV